MAANAAIILALLLGAGFFFWLAARAFRLRNPGARWALMILAAIPGTVFTLVAGVVIFGYTALYMPRQKPALTLDVVSTPDRVAHGEHIARTTCVSCHATNNDVPLSGGIDLASHISAPIGSIVPPNLTPAGALKDWSDQDIAQAIRNGRHKNGRSLVIMPATLRNLSDEDLVSIIAYLRSQPAVENDTPELNLSPLAAALIAAGIVEVPPPHVIGAVTAPPKGPNAAYGGYLMSYQDCQSCHGQDLKGMPAGLGAAAPSVVGVLQGWTVEEFIQTMRTGVDPSGHQIQEPMPWQMLGAMDDEELTAIYLYVRDLQ